MTATHTPTGTARVPGLISVIIPAYNQEPYINDALDSLAAQRLGRHRLQVIVVDDHSSDLTPTLVQDYRDRFEDLRLITHPENRGVSAARNTGLAAATGSYVTFLDPDDWFSRDHLASLADGLERLEVDFVRCDQVRVRGTSRSIHRAPQALHNVVLDPREDILPVDAASMIDYPYVFTGMYRHDVLGDTQWFDPALATCEDRPWLWRLYLSSTSYAVVGEASQFYRRNLPGSLTQVFDERQLHFIPAMIDDHGRNRLPGDGYTMHACFLRPRSRGTVTLASNRASDKPRIDPNYLGDPDGFDLKVMLECAKLSLEIFAQKAFDPYRGTLIFPPQLPRSEAELVAFVRSRAETVYHPVGTCKMGTDEMAVVDPATLIVRGVEGVRVIDASIMPFVTNGNTNAPTAMIGEKGARMLLDG